MHFKMIPYHNGYESEDYPYPNFAHSHPQVVEDQELDTRISRFFLKMPRVVPHQRDRFDIEDIFKRNAREMEVSMIKISQTYSIILGLGCSKKKTGYVKF